MSGEAREAPGASGPVRSAAVHRSENGMRLDRFVRIHFPDLPFGLLSSLLKRGGLTVDGRRAAATDRLAAGQVVALAGKPAADRRPPRAPSEAARLSPEDRAFLEALVVHADDDLLMFDKPSGLAVHAGTGTTRDLDSLLARWPGPDGERPVLVHRLDKDTSGLLVAARRRAVAAALGRAFAEGRVEKTYVAVVAGVPAPAEGAIARALAKVATPAGGRMVEVPPEAPRALAAVTRYRVEAVTPDGTRARLRLAPETGRQHQLRVHLALIGHPILGDRLYGGAPAPRLLLHAAGLRLEHPRTHGWLTLASAPPPEFAL
jgi:RluA family pseudouridine synthase